MEASDLTLVVGFGNTLRGDDALGAVVVELLSDRIEALAGDPSCPTVVLRQVHQPDVTLAAELANCKTVVFVDACQPAPTDGYSWTEIFPGFDTPFSSHICSLPSLLMLAKDVYGSAPTAHVLAVGGMDFDFASGISIPAKENAKKAVDSLLGFLQQIS